jgi:hypothetical protein
MAENPVELPADPVGFIEWATSSLHRLLATESEDTLPGVLHHYTSGQGLLGILSSGLHSMAISQGRLKAVRPVRHGPTVNPSLAIRSVGQYLHNLGYRDVTVGSSAIPLRF